jgi:hypothetical protein
MQFGQSIPNTLSAAVCSTEPFFMKGSRLLAFLPYLAAIYEVLGGDEEAPL